jgi:hypothetical protein
MARPITEQAVRELVDSWYHALDEHAELEKVTRFLADGFELHVPDGVYRGTEGFTAWYEAVTNRFFDEVHTISEVRPGIEGTRATVAISVNWQTRIWDPPAPRSVWLGFNAEQTWDVVAGKHHPVITRYVVNSLKPMPGSMSLWAPLAGEA